MKPVQHLPVDFILLNKKEFSINSPKSFKGKKLEISILLCRLKGIERISFHFIDINHLNQKLIQSVTTLTYSMRYSTKTRSIFEFSIIFETISSKKFKRNVQRNNQTGTFSKIFLYI